MKVIFCLPGKEFSDHWVRSWTETIAECSKHGIEWAMSMNYDPVVYYARNRVLGGNNTTGRTQKPFQSGFDYDYQFWIDSDIVWKASDVITLLSHGKNIVSGCYPMAHASEYPIVEKLDYDKLLEQGSFSFMQRDALDAKQGLFTANYIGFGFVAVAHGVMESMEYPWFRPRWVDKPPFLEFTAEDVGFCWSALEQGYEIWIDPAVRVGHLKSTVIR